MSKEHATPLPEEPSSESRPIDLGGSSRPFQIRSLVWTVYLPTFLLAMGRGLVLAAIPLYAKELGADFALIGVAAGAREVGTTLLDVPAGVFVSRFGRKPTMVAGTLAIGAFAIAAGLTNTIFLFIAARFGGGGATALWSISRQAYIADVVPVAQRGRALSLFGGITRLATIIGPAAGGALAFQFGLQAPFIAQGVLGLGTALLVATILKDSGERAPLREGPALFARLGQTVQEHKRDLSTAGFAAVALQLIRNGRQTLIPLWGDAIGLDVRAIGNIMSVSSVIDSTMFYPVGVVMDRWGRKWVLVPSLLVLSTSLTILPLTTGFVTLMAAGVLAGFGNGLGSGVVFTLGVDYAPRDRAGEFIGVWRLISDTGGAAGPFVAGWIAQVATLGTAPIAAGAMGYAGAAMAFFFVRETLRKPRRDPDALRNSTRT